MAPPAPSALVLAARAPDGVRRAPSGLAELRLERPFAWVDGLLEGVPVDGAAAVAAVRTLVREGGWRLGIGGGPLVVTSTRAGAGRARPPGYAAARVALAAAARTHQGVAVRASRGRGRPGPPSQAVDDAETCLRLLVDVWRRRSPEGWAVADLMDDGLTGRECARRLDISPSAVSQRASAARYGEARRATDLAARLLDALRPR